MDIVINQSVEKVIEPCEIPRCPDKIWMFVIAPFISCVVLILVTVSMVCCRKIRKNEARDGISNIHNVSVHAKCNFDSIVEYGTRVNHCNYFCLD